MAEGWKLETSRSERFIGSYSNFASAAEPDLREEEVWSMGVDPAGRHDHSRISGGDFTPRAADCNGRSHRRLRQPGTGRPLGGLSLAFEGGYGAGPTPRVVHKFRGHRDGQLQFHLATSAPVNVPDWHKIDSVEPMRHQDDGSGDDPGEEWVPPHVYLARRRQSAASSVFEGAGRTLKGRDMSRVREAVWSQTGFNG